MGRGRGGSKSEKKSYSDTMRRDADLCERITEPELGGSRRNKFRTKRAQHEVLSFGAIIATVTKTSDSDSLLR